MKNKIEEIWIDLNEELYRFINGKIRDEQITKDILQEVFLKINVKIDQLKDTSKLTSWVYQITRNTIFDYFRKQNKKTIAIEHYDIPENENEDFQYQKLSNCINQKIDNLSLNHKEAIILTAFKSYSQKELATYLNISYSGAKSRVQKARDVLKKEILNCSNVLHDKTGKLIDFDN
ncbi:sigma-70 family RNA polymerase sigma factor [Aquimarina sp. MMG016]|uniref:sigma-70 family RNA polymerase sigma factor n=1 Tax=Aquimarina sp. MMG016 TaxID=2822690 RepID=UPI001B39FF1A|nr:sigma-70 family RNA polymerase sigma factor [Aquimarina sp. MMG016]MBQ4819068.1 sigma-70 family RNA polymerase sigma factor [Aquimarina sp. MMG016]